MGGLDEQSVLVTAVVVVVNIVFNETIPIIV